MESRRKIRVLYRKCGSIKAVSRRTGISVPTVRKIVKSEAGLEVNYKRSVQKYPKLGEYKETLEKLLRDNRFAKPPRTGKMLFEDLQDRGYRGSYSAVNRYIELLPKVKNIKQHFVRRDRPYCTFLHAA